MNTFKYIIRRINYPLFLRRVTEKELKYAKLKNIINVEFCYYNDYIKEYYFRSDKCFCCHIPMYIRGTKIFRTKLEKYLYG